MIGSLTLRNVGPAQSLEVEFAPRLNLMTGDNGLGKSFLLDVAWWALTRRWPHEVNESIPAGFKAVPRNPKQPASISFSFEAKTKTKEQKSEFERDSQVWKRPPGRPPNPGLVIYAQADGGFSTWDPARNYWRDENAERPGAFVFSAAQVWNGLEAGSQTLCEGLLRDWATWQREKGETFNLLKQVLLKVSPTDEHLSPGDLTRIDLSARVYPTIRLAYGLDVPLVHASAGMRRVMALVYLLVWSWTEHIAASRLLGQDPSRSVTFLIDEVEAHLHPRWQRTVVPALMELVQELNPEATVQLLIATHSPLVMGSVETVFDSDQDTWLDLDLVDGQVVLTDRDYVRLGNAERWLLSEAFDLTSTGDPEIESELQQLEKDMKSTSFGKQAATHWDKRLRKLLGESHPYWSRWRTFVDLKRWKL
jgi:hypothetical protein